MEFQLIQYKSGVFASTGSSKNRQKHPEAKTPDFLKLPIHEMEREVEQNELLIVNKNTRKKQKEKKFEIFSGRSKKSCRKMAKMRQKHPISKKIRWICVGKIVKSKIILKRSKNTR